MLNKARPFFTRLMTPVGEVLARTPVTPNMVTVTGTVGVAASTLWGYPTGHLFLGTFVATIFVFLDMLDGVLARLKGTSGRWGAFLDSTMDRVADAAVFSGLAVWFVRGGHNQLLAAVSLFCLVVGALVSYVKARAEGLGVKANVGIAERPERMVDHIRGGGPVRPRRALHSSDRALGAGGGERRHAGPADVRRPPGDGGPDGGGARPGRRGHRGRREGRGRRGTPGTPTPHRPPRPRTRSIKPAREARRCLE